MAREVKVIAKDQDYLVHSDNGISQWVLDEPTDKGGQDLGPSPMEALLGAIGACMAITGRMYAQRKGWQIDDLSITLRLEEGSPGNRPVIVKDIQISGPLTEEEKDRIISIASKCPVSRLVQSGATIVTEA